MAPDDVLRIGRVEEWKNGRVEGWKDGRVEGWKDGRVEGWKGRAARRPSLPKMNGFFVARAAQGTGAPS